jgi:RNA polymerase sigma-70 factor (ECF subfamily)
MTSTADTDTAFAIELEASRPALMKFACRLSRDRSTAECAVQAALLRAWHCRAQLRDRGALRGWLLRICRREHARLYERKQLPTIDIDSLLPEQLPLVEDGDPVELAEIRRAVLGLDEKYRVPLVMQVLEGRSTAEIAGYLRIPRQTVLTRLFRARRLLRQMLDRGTAIPSGFQPINAAGAGRNRPSSQRRTTQGSMPQDQAARVPA